MFRRPVTRPRPTANTTWQPAPISADTSAAGAFPTSTPPRSAAVGTTPSAICNRLCGAASATRRWTTRSSDMTATRCASNSESLPKSSPAGRSEHRQLEIDGQSAHHPCILPRRSPRAVQAAEAIDVPGFVEAATANLPGMTVCVMEWPSPRANRVVGL